MPRKHRVCSSNESSVHASVSATAYQNRYVTCSGSGAKPARCDAVCGGSQIRNEGDRGGRTLDQPPEKRAARKWIRR